MKINIKAALAAAAITATLTGAAQQGLSGYFLDDYTYRYQINPAFANSKNFVAMPALGNMGLGINGTLGISDVLYNVNGRTTTFLNPNISASEALSKIGDWNRLGFSMNENILAFGFKAWGGYNTFSLSARANFGVKIPGSLFSLLKEGVANETYHIANLKGFANAFAQVQLGHSHQINSQLRIGANLKVLAGAGNAKIDMRQADLTLGTDAWTITTDAQIDVNMKGLTYKTKLNENTNHRYVEGVDVDNAGTSGFGVALDLGAVYKPAAGIKVLEDFEFSASLLDLGFISWSNNMLATTNGVKTVNSDRYTFNVDDEALNSFDNEWQKIKDDFSALYELDDAGDTGGRTTMLGATVNLGAVYTLPVWKKVKFGLLNTTRIQGDFSWTDFRLSANLIPCKVFDASVNMSAGTFGVGMGLMANLHVTGFNFFLGFDRLPMKVAKQGAPLNSNMQTTLGINFLF